MLQPSDDSLLNWASYICPGHSSAMQVLLTLLESQQSPAFYKRTIETLKDVLLDEQLAVVVSTLKGYSLALEQSDRSLPAGESYKLLWHCSQRMPYGCFHAAWNQKIGGR